MNTTQAMKPSASGGGAGPLNEMALATDALRQETARLMAALNAAAQKILNDLAAVRQDVARMKEQLNHLANTEST